MLFLNQQPLSMRILLFGCLQLALGLLTLVPAQGQAELSPAEKLAALGWTAQVLTAANTAQEADYLTADEKASILYLNLARLFPQKFATHMAATWKKLDGSSTYIIKRKLKAEEFGSLQVQLRQMEPVAALFPHPGLCKAAAYHADDMGQKGNIGHNSSDGRRFSVRAKEEGGYAAWAENCSYGMHHPFGVIMQLLIDDGVPSLGHRKNMLNGSYNLIGTAIRPHKMYGTNCVQDFGRGEVPETGLGQHYPAYLE